MIVFFVCLISYPTILCVYASQEADGQIDKVQAEETVIPRMRPEPKDSYDQENENEKISETVFIEGMYDLSEQKPIPPVVTKKEIANFAKFHAMQFDSCPDLVSDYEMSLRIRKQNSFGYTIHYIQTIPMCRSKFETKNGDKVTVATSSLKIAEKTKRKSKEVRHYIIIVYLVEAERTGKKIPSIMIRLILLR